MVYYIILPFCLAMSLVFCISRGKGFSVKNLILKCISSLCFILTGIVALFSNPNALIYGGLIIFGGALGLMGDIVLDLKGLYPKDEKAYMKAGFISFLAGHVFYSGAIIYAMRFRLWIILLCVLFAVIFAVCNLLSGKITKVDFGEYKTIVFIYTIFLALTLALSIAAVIISHFARCYVVLAIGALLFMLSDAVLSLTYFGKDKDTFAYYFINHLLYYAGQYMILASILLLPA